jgi:3-deoxy-D-manno-octulosonic-acid transferase
LEVLTCISVFDVLGGLFTRTYNLLWYPALPFVLAAVAEGPESWRQRLGLTPGYTPDESKLRVWVHAASVGEIEGVRRVVEHLARERSDLDFIVTTMTPAGRDAARRWLKGAVQLAPLDHPRAVHCFLKRIRPVLLIIAETELWPNFLLQSPLAGAKLALINARLSSRSIKRYLLVYPLMARALSRADLILVQTTHDAERFLKLGVDPERLTVTGNVKYELSGDPQPVRPALRNFARGRPILIAGSTAPGEEEVVVTAYRSLLERFPALALVLAPRHLRRIDQVVSILRNAGLSYNRASQLHGIEARGGQLLRELPRHGYEGAPANIQVLLLDTMGELASFYRFATVAFIGGSLRPGRGGQSLAEPAASSVPVLFGPYYENHRQLGDMLIAAGSGIVVGDASELAEAAGRWLTDPVRRATAGQRAYAVLQKLAGKSETVVRHLCALLPAQ